MIAHHISTYFIVSLIFQVSYLGICFLLLKKVFKRDIQEIKIGVDDIFAFSINGVKIIFGLTFFWVVGIKHIGHKNTVLRDKEFRLFAFVNITIKLFLLILVFILSGIGLSAAFYYLLYFCFFINFQQLKIALQHFNGFSLAVGILEIAVIFEMVSELIIRFIAESKIKRAEFLTNETLALLLYLRLVCSYIFNLE